MDYKEYQKKVSEEKERMNKIGLELRGIANSFYSTDGGKKLANQMLTAVKYFDTLPSSISDNDLRYLQAQRDFVNIFLISLIDKPVLLDILKERNNE